jgi:6,7-dimethyl-8-ribityllumazine synthase
MDTAVRNEVPVGNAILTVDTREQAIARAEGGINGKGGDAVRACVRILETKRAFWGASA